MSKHPWSITDILTATTGQLLSGPTDRIFSGVSIDSRQIQPHELFVAIVGDTHDGHHFVEQVLRQGVKGVILDKNQTVLPAWREQGATIIAVADTTAALGGLGAFNRRRSNIGLTAITGSNGKTTTRTMTAAVISQKYATLSAKHNFNNHIGAPLTLLEIEPRHQQAVLELGMNHPGEILALTEMCQPDIGVITNIGPAHLEGVGSLEGVMRAKGELLEKLDISATAILNADDPMLQRLAREIGLNTNNQRHCLFFGLSESADIRAEEIREIAEGLSFILIYPENRIQVKMKLYGRFLLSNALAAAAAGYRLGLSAEQIQAGLEAFRPIKGRLNLSHLSSGIHLLDDTYNANPGSMKAALAALEKLGGHSRKIFVAGEMFELGDQAAELHREIGQTAALTGITRFYAAGRYAQEFAAGAISSGLNPAQILIGDKTQIVQDLIGYVQPGDWILVKGSRSMKMETLIHNFLSAIGENPLTTR